MTRLLPAPASPAVPEPTARVADGRGRRRRLGDVLVAAGVLTPDRLATALAAQQAPGPRRRLGQVVVDLGLASEQHVAAALAEALHLEVVDLTGVPIDPDVARLLPRKVAERTGVVVLARLPRGLRIAACDPTNVVAFDDVRLYTGASELDVCVATDTQVRERIARIWSLAEDTAQMSAVVQSLSAEAEPEVADEPLPDTDDAPTVRLVTSVLSDAVRAGASDVHVEPQRDRLRVRYRIDGLLREVMVVPRSATSAVVSRLKIVAGLDIAERRVPQDGRMLLTVDGVEVDARVSTLPSVHGEKVVVRLLSRGDQVLPLEGTGLTGAQLALLRPALAASQGLVLITGPTGSGKTNTLYSAIREISTPERNIVTLEDPVEIQVAGLTQVQVHERAGMTFSRGLRAVLRQDPDIVLVGEVRDSETADLALKASLTGHLVLTTLHTNSAAAAVTRLVDMGVPPYLVASSLSVAVAQRLVRRPCEACAAPYEPEAPVLRALGLARDDLRGASPQRGAGCARCAGTGHRGRTGVFEVLAVNRSVRAALLSDGSEQAVAAAARAAGMPALRQSALALAAAGGTTFEEVARATPDDD